MSKRGATEFDADCSPEAKRALDGAAAALLAAKPPPALLNKFLADHFAAAAEAAEEVPPALAVVAAEKSDPRWDDAGFKTWADVSIDGRHAIAWLKAGFVRDLARKEGARLPHRQALERIPGAFHLGAPADDVELYYVSFAWQSYANDDSAGPYSCSADPQGHILRDMAAVLEQEGATDEDLVFMMFSSLFSYTDDGRWTSGKRGAPRDSCTESKLFFRMNDDFTPMLCYWRVRTILLPRVYGVDGANIMKTPFLDRLWAMLDVVLPAYCQRIIGLRSDAEAMALIRTGTDPARFEDLQDLFLRTLHTPWEGNRLLVWGLLRDALIRMPPVRHDAVGFNRFCDEGQIAWLRVGYIRELAGRGGPFPRRQELRPDGYIVGAPPAGRRTLVVSHGWETEVHPNPSGSKMRRLADTLARLQPPPTEDDLVFFDFCSLTQDAKMGRTYDGRAEGGDASAPAYFEHNRVSYYPDRTPKQRRAFGFAMWDMGRLYSYSGCEVVVLPTLEGLGRPAAERFPGGDVWGMVNRVPYQNRGWCCAEFSIASYCGIVANPDDDDVAALRNARRWPTDNASYAAMMRFTSKPENADDELTYDPELGVDFTNKGDRAVVKYNFFKMAISLAVQGPTEQREPSS